MLGEEKFRRVRGTTAFEELKGVLKKEVITARRCLSHHTSNPCQSKGREGPIASLASAGLDAVYDAGSGTRRVRMFFPNSYTSTDGLKFYYDSGNVVTSSKKNAEAEACFEILTVLLGAAPHAVRLPPAQFRRGLAGVMAAREAAERVAHTADAMTYSVWADVVPFGFAEPIPMTAPSQGADVFVPLRDGETQDNRDGEIIAFFKSRRRKRHVACRCDRELVSFLASMLPVKGLRPFLRRHDDIFRIVTEVPLEYEVMQTEDATARVPAAEERAMVAGCVSAPPQRQVVLAGSAADSPVVKAPPLPKKAPPPPPCEMRAPPPDVNDEAPPSVMKAPPPGIHEARPSLSAPPLPVPGQASGVMVKVPPPYWKAAPPTEMRAAPPGPNEAPPSVMKAPPPGCNEAPPCVEATPPAQISAAHSYYAATKAPPVKAAPPSWTAAPPSEMLAPPPGINEAPPCVEAKPQALISAALPGVQIAPPPGLTASSACVEGAALKRGDHPGARPCAEVSSEAPHVPPLPRFASLAGFLSAPARPVTAEVVGPEPVAPWFGEPAERGRSVDAKRTTSSSTTRPLPLTTLRSSGVQLDMIELLGDGRQLRRKTVNPAVSVQDSVQRLLDDDGADIAAHLRARAFQ